MKIDYVSSCDECRHLGIGVYSTYDCLHPKAGVFTMRTSDLNRINVDCPLDDVPDPTYQQERDALLEMGRRTMAGKISNEQEHIDDLLQSFKLTQESDGKSKSSDRILLEVFCAWLIGRTDKRPDKWDVDIFLSTGNYNRLNKPEISNHQFAEELERRWTEITNELFEFYHITEPGERFGAINIANAIKDELLKGSTK